MSLFRSSLRPPAVLSDEAVERYVAAIRGAIDPDPLFRRRLRGHVLNEYVAAREDIGSHRLAREMGRVGRAVLYASFALAVTVTGVMAASQQAIPGGPLYPLKRQIEDLRLHVLPAYLHDELAAHALGERIVELDRLAQAGDWDAVARHARTVNAAYAAVLAFGGDVDDVADRLAVAGALLDRLPAQARETVADVLADLRGVGPAGSTGAPGHGRDHGGVPPGQPAGGGPGDRPAATERAEPTAQPTPKPEPTKSPQAGESTEATERPEPTKPPKSTQASQPTPSGAPAPSGADRRGGHPTASPTEAP